VVEIVGSAASVWGSWVADAVPFHATSSATNAPGQVGGGGEMNMGQVMQSVKLALEHPERVFLANRIDSVFITPADIISILRIIQGKGV
jgi:hypothetical protein